jgi:hypothetical protein
VSDEFAVLAGVAAFAGLAAFAGVAVFAVCVLLAVPQANTNEQSAKITMRLKVFIFPPVLFIDSSLWAEKITICIQVGKADRNRLPKMPKKRKWTTCDSNRRSRYCTHISRRPATTDEPILSTTVV